MALVRTQDQVIIDLLTNVLRASEQADVMPGQVLRDIIINAPSTTISNLYSQINQVSINQSIANANLMSTADLDNLLANFGITRNGAATAFGQVTFYTSTLPSTAIIIPAGTILGTNLSTTATEMTFTTQFDVTFNPALSGIYFNPDCGRPSTNTTWGNEKCVLAGDWLYMQAFKVALQEKSLRVLDQLIALTQQMVEGELLQIQKLGRAVSEAEYYDLIYRKTACLFSVCMRLGALLADAPETLETSLAAYGRAVGLAFQIVDDVLDLTATEEVLGKPVASDLREGKATLAVIHSIDHGTASDRQTIQRVLDDRSFERVSREKIQAILARNGSVEYAMNVADRYAEQSRQALASLPESEYKRALLWVPDFVVAREK